MDVSIIIVNYNTYDVTKNCIESIFQYTHNIDFEVILVDNNSKDESYSIFSKDNRIIYLYQETNWGFGKANNIGYKQAKGKYLFLLNSDTLFKSNAVKEFYDFMESCSSNIACIGTILKDLNNNNIHSYGNFPTLISGLKWFTILGPIINKLGYKNVNEKHHSNFVDYITGADLFIKKSIAEKYGLFDPDFFMYFEETEMQYRFTKHGFKNYIYNTPQIIHLENYSMNNSYSNNLNKLSISLTSYYLYLKKCKGRFNYYLFRLIFAIICPLWIIFPRYSLSNKLNFIKKAYL